LLGSTLNYWAVVDATKIGVYFCLFDVVGGFLGWLVALREGWQWSSFFFFQNKKKAGTYSPTRPFLGGARPKEMDYLEN
jgi:hypothetical protein